MSGSDSSSEDEDEKRRRIEMSSCVMSAAQVAASAPPSKAQLREKNKEARSDAADEDDGEEVSDRPPQLPRPFQRAQGMRLHAMLAATLDSRVEDGVWAACHARSRCSSGLRVFSQSTKAQPCLWPPELPRTEPGGNGERARATLVAQLVAMASSATAGKRGRVCKRCGQWVVGAAAAKGAEHDVAEEAGGGDAGTDEAAARKAARKAERKAARREERKAERRRLRS